MQTLYVSIFYVLPAPEPSFLLLHSAETEVTKNTKFYYLIFGLL